MKKIAINKFFTKTAALALVLSATALPAHATDIAITVNGQPLSNDVPPTVVNNRVLLPLRACAEALNATVNYDAATGGIDVFAGQNKVELKLNSTTAAINGITQQLDTMPQVMDNRTLVPLRFLGEALNAQVNWDGTTGTVSIVGAATAGTANDNSTDNSTDSTADEPQDVAIPSMETIANQALQQINTVRLQKDLNSLVSATELGQLATAHSNDMSAADTLSNKLADGQSLAARASAAGIACPNELIACIDYSRENVYQAITAWFTNEPTRSLLLDSSAGYIGIAAAKAEGTNKVYLTAELMPHRAYFIGLPQTSTTNSPTLNLRGRSSRLQQEIIIYTISDKNPQMYTEKQTVTANGDGTYFTATVTLPAAGTYAIEAAGCTARVTYRP